MKSPGIALSLFVICASAMCVRAEGDVAGTVEGDIHTNWHIDLTDGARPKSAFDVSRAYLGYKMMIDEQFTGRVMVDVTRLHGEHLVAYLKYAYLEWKGLVPKSALVFGLHGLSQFKVQEKFWGYRYIYKSFMDKYQYGSSADLGTSLKAKPADNLAINVSVTNGEGYKKAQDADGRYKASLGSGIGISEAASSYVYVDIMPCAADVYQFTVAGFLGYAPEKTWRIGAEYAFQGNHGGVEESNYNGVSVYTAAEMGKTEPFARIDLFSSDDWENLETTVIAGIQYAPVKNLKVAPNLRLCIPAGENADPEPVIVLNGRYDF